MHSEIHCIALINIRPKNLKTGSDVSYFIPTQVTRDYIRPKLDKLTKGGSTICLCLNILYIYMQYEFYYNEGCKLSFVFLFESFMYFIDFKNFNKVV